MTITCPQCYAESSIETAIESEAGRDYARLLLSQPPAIQRALSAYVWMFRTAKRNLSYERRLKLAGEVLALGADPRALAAALSETVEALRAKREAGDVRPLTGHNYLRRVLESVTLSPVPAVGVTHESPVPAIHGKRRQAVEVLREWAAGSPLRMVVANGLTGLVVLGRPGTPAADIIAMTADLWLHWATKHGLVESEEDCARLYSAFSSLVQQPMKEWPEPASLAAHLPRRQPQARIEATPKSAEEIERERAAAIAAREEFERRFA